MVPVLALIKYNQYIDIQQTMLYSVPVKNY